jgi:hypothetical protein
MFSSTEGISQGNSTNPVKAYTAGSGDVTQKES